MWTCPKCQEQIEDQFDTCWKCSGETTGPQTTGPPGKTTRPLEHLESICLAIAFLPGVIFFVRGGATNSAQATFRIAAIIIFFLVGLGGYGAIKIYQRKKAKDRK